MWHLVNGVSKRKVILLQSSGKLLRYWVLAANAKGRFSHGSSETLLDQDIASIRDGGTIQDLIDRLRSQVGRLEISPAPCLLRKIW